MNDARTIVPQPKTPAHVSEIAVQPPTMAGTIGLAILYFVVIGSLLLLVAWPGYSELVSARHQAEIEEHQAYLTLFEQKTNQNIHTAGSVIKLLSRMELTSFAMSQGQSGQDNWLTIYDVSNGHSPFCRVCVFMMLRAI